MFHDPSAYPFLAELEANWKQVRAELDELEHDRFLAWPERDIYNFGWDVFGLHAYGKKLAENCEKCPRTAELVERIPGMTTAGFSRLVPGTHIKPHVGYTSAVLRCHLGVVVPLGCALRVGPETRSWKEGRCLLFDDCTEHEAWHWGVSARVVLLVDFLRPQAGQRADALVCSAEVMEVLRKIGGTTH
jgi:aspartyl/asparaginyl beta-hydroxylase (cupin superfamily)